MILEVTRLWGREPGWFYDQEPEVQTQLLAWFRVHLDPTGEAGKKRKGKGRAGITASKGASSFWGL